MFLKLAAEREKMGRKLRILQVNKLYYPFTGGIEAVVQQIAEGLQQVSIMQVLVCNTKRQTIKEKVNGVKVTRTGCIGMLGNLPLSIRFLTEFRKQAKGKDILFFHMPFPIGDVAYWLSGSRKKNIIVWWHSDIVRQKKLLFFYKPLMNWFLKKAVRIVVATEGHIEGSDYLKPFQEKCVKIPFGVREEVLKDSTDYLLQQTIKEKEKEIEQTAKNRQKALQTDREEIRFLFVGRLIYYKGCDVLLKAFQGIAGAKLVMVGDGPLKNQIEQKLAVYHMQEKVELKGWLRDPELFEEYRSCDVLILPSVVKSEAFGLVQIEAMAYGKPVINTRIPSGVPYVSLDKKTGLTVTPGSVEELQQAIRWMIENHRERSAMGRAARIRVEECFTRKNMLQKLMNLCREVVTESKLEQNKKQSEKIMLWNRAAKGKEKKIKSEKRLL